MNQQRKEKKVKELNRLKKKQQLLKWKDELKTLEQKRVEIQERNKLARKQKRIEQMKTILKTTLPITIASFVIVGGMNGIGAGYPFVIDKEKKPKFITLDIDKENIIKKESFQKEQYDEYLIVTTPWKKTETGYSRMIRNYQVPNSLNEEVFSVLMNQNLQELPNFFPEFKDEEEFVTDVSELNPNYTIKAHLRCLNKEEFIEVPESLFSNIGITLLELFLILGIELVSLYSLDCNPKEEWSNHNYFYKQVKTDEIDKKIESLKKQIKTRTKQVTR